MVSHNHANYQARLGFIRQRILQGRLGLTAEELERTTVRPIQYDPEYPFKYNNFVYCVTLPLCEIPRYGVVAEVPEPPRQPGCVPVPAGTRDFILRLTNHDAEGMHQATRVENEVAIMSLASDALRHVEPPVVPRVFAWASAAGGNAQGWILQERMPGTPASEAFETMDMDMKKAVVAHMAKLLAGLQRYELPDSITGFGGVTFDEAGRVVSAPMVNVGAGPWPSYQEYYLGRLRAILARADANTLIKGWRADDGTVRERLDAFLERGLSDLFDSLSSRDEKAIVHADFNISNILVDPFSGRITGLIDYDFSSILHPSFEFFRSFSGKEVGQLSGWVGDEEDENPNAAKDEEETKVARRARIALRKAKLTGSFPSVRPTFEDMDWNWDLAEAWEGELKAQGTKRPSAMPGIDKVADVDELLRAILPWQLDNADFLGRQSQDVVERMKVYFGKELSKMMDHMRI